MKDFIEKNTGNESIVRYSKSLQGNNIRWNADSTGFSMDITSEGVDIIIDGKEFKNCKLQPNNNILTLGDQATYTEDSITFNVRVRSEKEDE